MEFRVVVKLLTQQFTATSGVGVKIDEDQLVIAFGLGYRLVQGALEPILGRSHRGERKHQERGKEFFHAPTIKIAS